MLRRNHPLFSLGGGDAGVPARTLERRRMVGSLYAAAAAGEVGEKRASIASRQNLMRRRATARLEVWSETWAVSRLKDLMAR